MLKAAVSDPAAIPQASRIQVISENLRNEKINTRWGDAHFDSSGRALLAVPENERHMLKNLGMTYQSEIDADLARTVRSDQQEAVLPRSKTDYLHYCNQLEARLVDLREQLDGCAGENTTLRREADQLRAAIEKSVRDHELQSKILSQSMLDLQAAQARIKQLEGASHNEDSEDEEAAPQEGQPKLTKAEKKAARLAARST
jgi:regulator of replication initiation timing